MSESNGVAVVKADPGLVMVRDMLRGMASRLGVNQSNPLVSRQVALGGTSILNPAGRDLEFDCGYEKNPTIKYYKELHDRNEVANRVNYIWPDECWAAYPELYETEEARNTPFEKRWLQIQKRVSPWHYLHRADRQSRIGNYGGLLLGLDDGRPLSKPPLGVNARTGKLRKSGRALDLLYLRAFNQSCFEILELEQDDASPRYMQPKTYRLTQNSIDTDSDIPAIAFEDTKVHWTRVIHLADNREGSDVFGVPSCRPVLNRLSDIRKVAGSSAEMFWRAGFPIMMFQTDPDITGEAAIDEEAVKNEVRNLVLNMQRYLTAVGGRWEALQMQIADPSPNLTQQLTLLCACIGVPLRIFLGSESGHLASTQDAGTWKERLRGRQTNYLEPMVVNPFVDRLMDFGILPRVPSYIVSWRDLKTLGDKDRSEVALKITQALMQYVTGDVQQVLPKKFLYSTVLGLSDQQGAAILKELKANPPPKPMQLQTAQLSAKAAMATAKAKPGGKPQGGGQRGSKVKAAGRKPGPPKSNR
jgi:hypothetical protein